MFEGVAYAQEAGGGFAQGFIGLFPLILIFLIFYFLLIRPQQKKAKEHREMLSAIKKGDEVITSGGIHGNIVGIADNVITLEIANNVRVKVSREYIAAKK